MKIKLEVMNANGLERTLTLPAKYEICGFCHGKGTHVNPNVDGHGISPDEFAEDPDFEEAYFSGVYDVRCHADCDNGKMLVVDFDKLPKRLADRIMKEQNDRAAYESECRHERKMGY